MATSADRMRAHRERARRGLRRLTIDVSEDQVEETDVEPAPEYLQTEEPPPSDDEPVDW
jgi:hypothetical protein